jgi:hypothetical protein
VRRLRMGGFGPWQGDAVAAARLRHEAPPRNPRQALRHGALHVQRPQHDVLGQGAGMVRAERGRGDGAAGSDRNPRRSCVGRARPPAGGPGPPRVRVCCVLCAVAARPFPRRGAARQRRPAYPSPSRRPRPAPSPPLSQKRPNDIEATELNGRKQHDKARKLWAAAGTPVTGAVGGRHVWVDMTNVTVEPGKFNGPGKTCPAAMGFAFAAGTTDGGRPGGRAGAAGRGGRCGRPCGAAPQQGRGRGAGLGPAAAAGRKSAAGRRARRLAPVKPTQSTPTLNPTTLARTRPRGLLLRPGRPQRLGAVAPRPQRAAHAVQGAGGEAGRSQAAGAGMRGSRSAAAAHPLQAAHAPRATRPHQPRAPPPPAPRPRAAPRRAARARQSCHAPKPIILDAGEMGFPYPWVPSVVDVSLLRVGSLVIACIPGEMTTMAGRRLVRAVEDAVGGAWGPKLKARGGRGAGGK